MKKFIAVCFLIIGMVLVAAPYVQANDPPETQNSELCVIQAETNNPITFAFVHSQEGMFHNPGDIECYTAARQTILFADSRFYYNAATLIINTNEKQAPEDSVFLRSNLQNDPIPHDPVDTSVWKTEFG